MNLSPKPLTECLPLGSFAIDTRGWTGEVVTHYYDTDEVVLYFEDGTEARYPASSVTPTYNSY